ncbi:hypothetical protein GCM10022254_69870 [Actinomadura meridiana]|uniref:Uncharacterized protein n=1 Tax=Actinomadura meridiana TaxID=559626 RepID=A0ABP8CNF6_9ACTN
MLDVVQASQQRGEQVVLVGEVMGQDAGALPERLRDGTHRQTGHPVLGEMVEDRVEDLDATTWITRPGHGRISFAHRDDHPIGKRVLP